MCSVESKNRKLTEQKLFLKGCGELQYLILEFSLVSILKIIKIAE